uniref:Uncharacterized protein n=1 Tax=Rhizophora mucronata TaxID=61149 RepID=A0A2P2PVJ5_RHIMU
MACCCQLDYRIRLPKFLILLQCMLANCSLNHILQQAIIGICSHRQVAPC